MKKSCREKKVANRVLRLPDFDYAKGAVLNTLGSPEAAFRHHRVPTSAITCVFCRNRLTAPAEQFAPGALIEEWNTASKISRNMV